MPAPSATSAASPARGRANRIKDPTLDHFHRPPPVIAGSFAAESEYRVSDTECGTVKFDGVFGTFKNSESIEYTPAGR